MLQQIISLNFKHWRRQTHQERSVFFERNFPGGFDGVVDGEDVVAVNSDGGDAVRRTPDSDAVTAVLLARRRGDGVTVVSAEEKQKKIL